MSNIFKINKKAVFVIYIILDTLLVGIGMGVPFFCMLLGFPAGWYIAKRLTLSKMSTNDVLNRILKYAIFTSCVTFAWMLAIWGPISAMILNNDTDFANFGIPMILYDPKISFIGWITLMIFISPFLQLIITIFASHVALWKISKKEELKPKKEVYCP